MTNFFMRSGAGSRLAFWVPSIYMTMGFPNVFVASAAAIMYRNLGMTTEQVVMYTSQLYLPWVLKPIWAPLLESFGTKRRWVLAMQFILMTAFGFAALSLTGSCAVPLTLCFFWIIGFASATQDIAIDGIFMSATSSTEQSRYAGVQNLCWNIGAVIASGIIVSLSGVLRNTHTLSWPQCWMMVLLVCSLFMGASAIWHMTTLPHTQAIVGTDYRLSDAFKSFGHAWRTFVAKPKIWTMLAVVFMYRLAEGFLEKISPLFLLDSRHLGGLGLDNQTLGTINGTFGTVAFIAGTIVASFVVSKMTLRRSFFILAVSLNLPHLTYYWLSMDLPSNLAAISGAVLLEKFGYGIGSVGHMLYMVQQVSPRRFQMSHYAFATSVMALCKCVTGWVSGPLFTAFHHNYHTFFMFVLVMSIPPVIVAYFAPFSLVEARPALLHKSGPATANSGHR
jgi:MFS transporter, PAT family, beta-lactamase induction signal transducer AmpG